MNIATLHQLFCQHYLVDTDTRKIRKNTLFFALKGANFNGNTFAKEALNLGASYVIIDEEAFFINEKTILVKDVLSTLQELATYHRTKLNIPIIGLTGSNGKTTTKELINTILSTQYKTTATIGNLNNHIGVPLTLLSMTNTTEIGIVEMGANHLKEIEFLCTIAKPDYGYITNFGKAHLEGFGGIEGVIKGKSELYDYLKTQHKTAFVNPNDAIQIEKTQNINRILFDQSIEFIEANPFVKLKYQNSIIQSQLIGSYNYSNMAAAISIGKHFNIDLNNIIKALENYHSTNNRSQVIKTKHNTIILDAYNANPTSMLAALENFKSLVTKDKKMVILGDMFELGATSIDEHQKIKSTCQELAFDECLFVGKLFSKQPSKFLQFESFKDLEAHLKTYSVKNHHILIKGSRGMALERILDFID